MELAKELGLKIDGLGPEDRDLWGVQWDGRAVITRLGGHVNSPHTPEAFISNMRVTAKVLASKPKPIRVNDYDVQFLDGKIKIGCTTVENSVVRAIVERLKD